MNYFGLATLLLVGLVSLNLGADLSLATKPSTIARRLKRVGSAAADLLDPRPRCQACAPGAASCARQCSATIVNNFSVGAGAAKQANFNQQSAGRSSSRGASIQGHIGAEMGYQRSRQASFAGSGPAAAQQVQQASSKQRRFSLSGGLAAERNSQRNYAAYQNGDQGAQYAEDYNRQYQAGAAGGFEVSGRGYKRAVAREVAREGLERVAPVIQRTYSSGRDKLSRLKSGFRDRASATRVEGNLGGSIGFSRQKSGARYTAQEAQSVRDARYGYEGQVAHEQPVAAPEPEPVEQDQPGAYESQYPADFEYHQRQASSYQRQASYRGRVLGADQADYGDELEDDLDQAGDYYEYEDEQDEAAPPVDAGGYYEDQADAAGRVAYADQRRFDARQVSYNRRQGVEGHFEGHAGGQVSSSQRRETVRQAGTATNVDLGASGAQRQADNQQRYDALEQEAYERYMQHEEQKERARQSRRHIGVKGDVGASLKFKAGRNHEYGVDMGVKGAAALDKLSSVRSASRRLRRGHSGHRRARSSHCTRNGRC